MQISRDYCFYVFYGYKKHKKPHVHAKYGDSIIAIGIDGEILSGILPSKQLKLLQAWLVLHEEELYTAWDKAIKGQPLEKLPPLQ